MKKKILPLTLSILLFFTGVIVYAQIVLPEHSKVFYINDFANVIEENVEESITKINLNYEKTIEKPQIVVVTVQNMQGLDENSYATSLFEKWKIGNKQYDNGILILLAIDERRIKIETGYGLEGVITDAKSGRILDSSTNYLSKEDYSKGIENIVFQLAKNVNEEYKFDDSIIFQNIDVNVDNRVSRNNVELSSIIRLIVLIVLFIFFRGFGGGSGRRRRKSGFYISPTIFRGGGGFGGGGFGGGGSSGGGGAGRGF